MRTSFVHLSAFTTSWKRMSLTDEDLGLLENAIQRRPGGPPVMPGTGGLRKIRFAPAHGSGGKSGGGRVCYAYLPEYHLVYLCAVFPKHEKANLSDAEKRAYKRVLESFSRYLKDHWEKGLTP